LQIQNLATGASWSAISTADGSWRMIGLPSGTYQVTATASGFKNTVLNLSYDAANPHAYRVGLNVGATSDSVIIETSALEMNTERSTISSKDQEAQERAARCSSSATNSVSQRFQLAAACGRRSACSRGRPACRNLVSLHPPAGRKRGDQTQLHL